MPKMLFVVALSLVLLLSGCGQEVPQEPDEATEAAEPAPPESWEFMLDSLPELAPFTPYTELSDRFYPEYTDHLIPRDDYGRLYPFVGKVLAWPESVISSPVYGLCDERGRVVVDPVYDSYYIVQAEDQDILVLTRSITENLGDFDYAKSVCLAAADGSWVTEPVIGELLRGDEQGFVIMADRRNVTEGGSGQEPREGNWRGTYIYNTRGELTNVIYVVVAFGYSEGGLTVGRVEGDTMEYCLLDTDGNEIFSSPYQFHGTFHGEYAAVALSNNEYVLVDREGNYDPEDTYAMLDYYHIADGFHFRRHNGEQGFLDREGRPIPQAEGCYDFWRQEDVFNGHPVIGWARHGADPEKEENEYCIMDEATGAVFERSLPYGSMPDYLGSGWVACASSQDDGERVLELYRLQEGAAAKAVYRFRNASDAALLSPKVAAISLREKVEDEYGGSYYQETEVLLLDLETGEEIRRIPGLVSDCIPELGIVEIMRPNWSYAYLYDDAGRLLLDGGYTMLREAGNGYYVAYGAPYAGLLDEKGQWVIRYCVNSTD